MRQALLLDAPAPTVAAAIAHHGYIQIYPITWQRPQARFHVA